MIAYSQLLEYMATVAGRLMQWRHLVTLEPDTS